MNFKNFFGAALTVMCALVMSTTLTACGSDDDNDSKGGGDDFTEGALFVELYLSHDVSTFLLDFL